MRIGSSQEVRNIDKACIEQYGIPSIVLMENAALKLLKNIDVENHEKFTIICGIGNNGGDGFALARLLIANRKEVKVFVVSNSKEMSKDCKINFNILKQLNAYIKNIHSENDIGDLRECISNSDIVIDGIFGTGLTREISGVYKDVVEAINKLSKYTVAIDVPTGLNSDTGKVMGCCVKATKTVTFQLYKIGFLNYESKNYLGEIILEEINIPDIIVENNHKKIFMTTKAFIKENTPVRDRYKHKGDFGRSIIFAGSEGFSGAAYICTQAVVRSGGGLVTLCCNKGIQNILSEKLTEAMTITYDDDYEGMAKKSDVIALGPGMGNNEFTLSILEKIISNNKPLVIDADGINVLQGKLHLLKLATNKVIITPHLGEMARLTGYSIDYINENRIQVAIEFAKNNNVIVLLKGFNTIITDGENTYVNPTGNSSMASGGMGDCLTGIITSLIGQKIEPFKAVIIGAYIHGYIGDKLSENMYCVNATHIIEQIPYVLKEIVDI